MAFDVDTNNIAGSMYPKAINYDVNIQDPIAEEEER
jgi:hypothetical protein